MSNKGPGGLVETTWLFCPPAEHGGGERMI